MSPCRIKRFPSLSILGFLHDERSHAPELSLSPKTNNRRTNTTRYKGERVAGTSVIPWNQPCLFELPDHGKQEMCRARSEVQACIKHEKSVYKTLIRLSAATWTGLSAELICCLIYHRLCFAASFVNILSPSALMTSWMNSYINIQLFNLKMGPLIYIYNCIWISMGFFIQTMTGGWPLCSPSGHSPLLWIFSLFQNFNCV